MHDFAIGYVFQTKITTKWQSNQLKLQNVHVFTYKINFSGKFAAVSLPVCEASEASKKFLKHVVIFIVL